jgi:hypothetical protein
MKTYNKIRDFIDDTQLIEPPRTAAEELVGVALPGDSVVGVQNEFVGKNPQALNRLYLSGTLNSTQMEQVRQAIRIYEMASGERLSGGLLNHRSRQLPTSPILADVETNPDRDLQLEDLFR